MGLITVVVLDLVEDAESAGINAVVEELKVIEVLSCVERLELSDAMGMPVAAELVEVVGYIGLFEAAKVLRSV